jgi:hypothetical protein
MDNRRSQTVGNDKGFDCLAVGEALSLAVFDSGPARDDATSNLEAERGQTRGEGSPSDNEAHRLACPGLQSGVLGAKNHCH